MFQKVISMMMCIAIALSLTACGEPSQSNRTPQDPLNGGISSIDLPDAPSSPFSFADIRSLEFTFSSGAGAWRTQLIVRPDGSFSGEYLDSDMGDIGEGYPNGICYQAIFSGRFSKPKKINDYTYSTQIETLDYKNEVGTKEIRGGTLYSYSEAYGISGTKDILIYLPGAPLEKLPEEFLAWVGYALPLSGEETVLPFCGLFNKAQGNGFRSFDFIESTNDMLASLESDDKALYSELTDTSLPMADAEQKAEELYLSWDRMLNRIWGILNQVLEPDAMHELTVQELEWIRAKEDAIVQSRAAAEGDASVAVTAYRTAAGLTKERTYELFALLKDAVG